MAYNKQLFHQFSQYLFSLLLSCVNLYTCTSTLQRVLTWCKGSVPGSRGSEIFRFHVKVHLTTILCVWKPSFKVAKHCGNVQPPSFSVSSIGASQNRTRGAENCTSFYKQLSSQKISRSFRIIEIKHKFVDFNTELAYLCKSYSLHLSLAGPFQYQLTWLMTDKY